MQQLTKKLLDKKGTTLAKVLFGVYSLSLLVITLMPTVVFKSKEGSWLSTINFRNGDKVVHAALFFIFTLLLFYSAYVSEKFRLILIPVLVGIGIEIAQFATGWGRTFDLFDILANTIGTFIAFFLIQKLTPPKP